MNQNVNTNESSYPFKSIESKWQKYWLENKTFKTENKTNKPKYYILDMFPYPSGDGLHVGHPEGYTATDIVSRFKRMKGFNVLHPMGWDAFGLPAEQHAIRTGTHPKITTEKNINRFREQIRSLGLSYDWDREIDTTAADYVKWTQWIFLKLYEKGLAYESYESVNWCEALGTVLANEEVIDGKSEVGSHPVIKKPMRQWVLKITAYAERLLEDLKLVDWPEPIKEMQRNWIGKSEGCEIHYKLSDSKESIKIYTTRADTVFGVSFIVIAPEHPLVASLTDQNQKSAVQAYCEKSKMKSDRDRIADLTKTGVFTGSYVDCPFRSNKKIPIFVGDYVLMHYGNGAVIGVPAHDSRDHEFAKKYHLELLPVVKAPSEHDYELSSFNEDGIHINSDFINGLNIKDSLEKIFKYVEEKKIGRPTVQYKLRDWLFSRQRYWGEPIPVIRDRDGNNVPLKESDLPVLLPALEDFRPSGNGESPLAKAKDWLQVKINNIEFFRETNTMPQWAGSCWYYLRFIDPRNTEEAWDKQLESYWMPVDLYVGGAEHAVLHLLYARFWHKVLYDAGLVSTPEPFHRLVNQGMILGENGEKMSKSRGNVVNPDDVIQEWGADSLRLYEMFMGPLEATKPWQTSGISGCSRFLRRVYKLYFNDEHQLHTKVSTNKSSENLKMMLHKTIKKVAEDTEALRFNTAIAMMMEFCNACYKDDSFDLECAEKFCLILSPYAPHLSEEIWEKLGHKQTLAYEKFPDFNEKLTTESTLKISVQINGKMRELLEIPRDFSQEEVISLAKASPQVIKHLDGKIILKEIFVPGKIINFVVK